MAEENVKVDLKSTADTTGFDKFEASYNSLRAAKQQHVQSNEVLVDSERRVRTNLSDLVVGLSQSESAADATSIAIKHLSEVFQLGFAGGILGGVVAAIIGAFNKADEAIAKTREGIEKSVDELKTLDEEITGRKLSPELKEEQGLRKQQTDFAASQFEIDHPGFVRMAAMGAENLFGVGSSSTNYKASISDQALRAGVMQQATTDLAVKRVNESFTKIAASVDNFSWGKGKPEVGKLGTRDFELALEAEEGDKAAAARASEQAGKAERAAAEADRKKEEAAREEARKANEAQAAAAREEAKDERDESRQGRIKATILAGSQRQLGGGGGVYSVITRDPVLEENRKQTTIQTDIASMLRNMAASARPMATATLA
jgi:hypothetical protein